MGADHEDLEFDVDFIVLLITSIAERTTDQGTTGALLLRRADLVSDMLIAQFGIS